MEDFLQVIGYMVAGGIFAVILLSLAGRLNNSED